MGFQFTAEEEERIARLEVEFDPEVLWAGKGIKEALSPDEWQRMVRYARADLHRSIRWALCTINLARFHVEVVGAQFTNTSAFTDAHEQLVCESENVPDNLRDDAYIELRERISETLGTEFAELCYELVHGEGSPSSRVEEIVLKELEQFAKCAL